MDLGAIDIESGFHTIPILASKSKKYVCPECSEYVFVKQGKIRKAHFSHYAKSVCNYYDHPNESQIHKDCKFRLKSWLEQKISLNIFYKCFNSDCKRYFNKLSILLEEDDKVILEYRDPEGKYVADLAILNKDKVKYIFEVLHTHSTETERPEPWFEFRTSDLIDITPKESIGLFNVRNSYEDDYECYNCKYELFNPGAFDSSNRYYLADDENKDIDLFCMKCKKPVKLEVAYTKPLIKKQFKRFKHIESSDCEYYNYWNYDKEEIFNELDIDALYKLVKIIQTNMNKNSEIDPCLITSYIEKEADLKVWWRCGYLRDNKWSCKMSDFEGEYPTIDLKFKQSYQFRLNKKTKTLTVLDKETIKYKFIIGEPKDDKNENHYYFDKEDVFWIETDINDLCGALNVYNKNQKKYCSDCEEFIEHLFDDD